jgi:hypothetical protein
MTGPHVGAPYIPAPPPGPGVQPPFPAPPVEGRGKRIGLGIGVGIGVLVLVCGGGLAALIGVIVSTSGALQEHAEAAVADYLGALHDKKYDRAYDLLCEQARQDESPGEFRERVSAEEPIERWTVGDFNVVTLAVPVTATYADGDTANLEAYMGQNRTTGEFEVCRLGE